MKVKVTIAFDSKELESFLNDIGYENVLNVLYGEVPADQKHMAKSKTAYTIIYKE